MTDDAPAGGPGPADPGIGSAAGPGYAGTSGGDAGGTRGDGLLARPRDGRGNAFNDRPRDALGRPLPRGSVGVPRQPEGIARTAAQTLDLAEDLLARRFPFHAHDVFEDHWKHTDGPERRLWRGLAQLAVGVTHAARGNPRGAAAVLTRAADSIAPFRDDPPHGLDVTGIHAWAVRQSARIAHSSAAGSPDGRGVGAQWLDVPPLRDASPGVR